MHADLTVSTSPSNAPGVACGDLVRLPWMPCNMVIKRPGVPMCNNRDCMTPATVAFEEGHAVWLACDSCTPEHVQNLTRLRLPNAIGEATPPEPR